MPRGFILQPTYRIENGKAVVRIYGRLESGGSFLIRDDRCVPRFWIRAEDEARARNLGAAVRDKTPPRVTMQGEPVVRVEVPTPPDTPAVRDRLVEAGIACYEADVRFAYRYLIDRGIRGSVRIDGESQRGEGVEAVFVNPEVGPADWAPALTVLSLDIETDPSARDLLSIALAGCGADDVLLLTRNGMSCPGGAVACESEADILRAFVRRVRDLDPDVITGWNVIDFDLAVLSRIAERTGVPLRLGRGPEPLALKPPPFPRASRQATVTGRVVLDGIDLLRGAFIKLDSYALDAVSMQYLGEGKTITGSGRAEEILEAFHGDRDGFVEYNRKDAWLALRILEKLRLVELSVKRSMLTGMPPDRVSASIASFDFLYLTELTRRGVVAPTVRSSSMDTGEETSGGHVLEPVPGLHRNVLVFDFKSLYPSIIRTFQIGLTIGLAKSKLGKNQIWFVFEAVNHRIQKSLSDLNGTDIYVHHGTVKGVFRELGNSLVRSVGRPTVAEMTKVYNRLRKALPEIMKRRGATSAFQASVFHDLVFLAASLRKAVIKP